MKQPFPDSHSILVYNRRIRAQLKKKEKAFKSAGEKLRAMRNKLNSERHSGRTMESKISKLESKLRATKTEAQEKQQELEKALAKIKHLLR